MGRRDSRQSGFGVVDGIDIALLEQDGFLIRSHQDRAERVMTKADRTLGDFVCVTQMSQQLFAAWAEPLRGQA